MKHLLLLLSVVVTASLSQAQILRNIPFNPERLYVSAKQQGFTEEEASAIVRYFEGSHYYRDTKTNKVRKIPYAIEVVKAHIPFPSLGQKFTTTRFQTNNHLECFLWTYYKISPQGLQIAVEGASVASCQPL